MLLAKPLAEAASPLAFYERLKAENATPALDALILFAHWITPPILAKRFDTRFFMARIPPDQTPAHRS